MQNVCKKGQIFQDYFSPEYQIFLKSYGPIKSDILYRRYNRLILRRPRPSGSHKKKLNQDIKAFQGL